MKQDINFIKILSIKRWRLVLGGLCVVVNRQALNFLGYETQVGIILPQRRTREGQAVRFIGYHKLMPN